MQGDLHTKELREKHEIVADNPMEIANFESITKTTRKGGWGETTWMNVIQVGGTFTRFGL